MFRRVLHQPKEELRSTCSKLPAFYMTAMLIVSHNITYTICTLYKATCKPFFQQLKSHSKAHQYMLTVNSCCQFCLQQQFTATYIDANFVTIIRYNCCTCTHAVHNCTTPVQILKYKLLILMLILYP